jgi:hypothetical protein
LKNENTEAIKTSIAFSPQLRRSRIRHPEDQAGAEAAEEEAKDAEANEQIGRSSMPPIELIRSFLQQASVQGSRSTVLNPIGWAFALVLSALLASAWAQAPFWVVVLFAVFASLILIVFLISYIYCMVNDRDALRSERFSLSKMAIERSVVGDTLKGFSEVQKGEPPAVVSEIASREP